MEEWCEVKKWWRSRGCMDDMKLDKGLAGFYRA